MPSRRRRRRPGAAVTLVSGPVGIADPPGVATVHVESAREMLAAVENALPADIAVFAAAVADWRHRGRGRGEDQEGRQAPAGPRPRREPRHPRHRRASESGRPPLVVGFAAETEKVIEHARAKLKKKGCDLIVANDVAPGTGVMGGTSNTVHLVTARRGRDLADPRQGRGRAAPRRALRRDGGAGRFVIAVRCRRLRARRRPARCRTTRPKAPPALTSSRPIPRIRRS